MCVRVRIRVRIRVRVRAGGHLEATEGHGGGGQLVAALLRGQHQAHVATHLVRVRVRVRREAQGTRSHAPALRVGHVHVVARH